MLKAKKILCALCLVPYAALAKSGGVNYSWGADALATIYIKMNTGEDGVVKSIVSLVGACLFIIGASIVFPAFFGYRI